MAATTIGQVRAVWKSEARRFWRQRHQLGIYAFYAVVLAYLIQLIVPEPTPRQYVALFWISALFINLQLGAQAYHQETRGHLLFYYWIVPPGLMFWMRALFNAFSQAFIMGLLALLFAFFLGPLPIGVVQWALLIVLSALGFGFAFSLVSAISRFGRQPFVLMSVLGIPTIIPLFFAAIHIHLSLLSSPPSLRMWLTLPALWGIVSGVGTVLMPYLQRH